MTDATATQLPTSFASLTPAEIQALKLLVDKADKPWWKDYPFLVALLAFLLSLFTALVSAYTSHQRDIHDQQTQLSAALGLLQDLNLKTVEMHEKYKGTPFEGMASGLINNQISSTLHTAAKLGLELGTHATTADLSGIAQGTYGLGDYETTEKLLKYALQVADTANDESIALRSLGFYSIRTGRGGKALKDGEEYFERALNLDRKYNLSEQPQVIMWTRSAAHLWWAGALATTDCPAAQKHFSDGVQILQGAPSNIDFDQARSNAKQQWLSGIGGVPSCRPDPGTPPLA